MSVSQEKKYEFKVTGPVCEGEGEVLVQGLPKECKEFHVLVDHRGHCDKKNRVHINAECYHLTDKRVFTIPCGLRVCDDCTAKHQKYMGPTGVKKAK